MSSLLVVLTNCLPKMKCPPKQVYFICVCVSHTELFSTDNTTYTIRNEHMKEKKKKPLFLTASIHGHLTWKVLAMTASVFHKINNQNKLLKPQNCGKWLGSSAGQVAQLLQGLVQGLLFQTESSWQHSEFLDISLQMLLVHKTLKTLKKWPINSRYLYIYSIFYWNQARVRSVGVGFNSKQLILLDWT